LRVRVCLGRTRGGRVWRRLAGAGWLGARIRTCTGGRRGVQNRSFRLVAVSRFYFPPTQIRDPRGESRRTSPVVRAGHSGRPEDLWEAARPGPGDRCRVGRTEKVVKRRAAGDRPWWEGDFGVG